MDFNGKFVPLTQMCLPNNASMGNEWRAGTPGTQSERVGSAQSEEEKAPGRT